MEILILAILGIWLTLALRSCRRKKGGCNGNCGSCKGCH